MNNIFILYLIDFTCSIPLLCCDHFRPNYNVFYTEEGSKYMMGKIINPMGCFGSYIEILDDYLEIIYTIKPEFC